MFVDEDKDCESDILRIAYSHMCNKSGVDYVCDEDA